jgi:hypothetical protein
MLSNKLGGSLLGSGGFFVFFGIVKNPWFKCVGVGASYDSASSVMTRWFMMYCRRSGVFRPM